MSTPQVPSSPNELDTETAQLSRDENELVSLLAEWAQLRMDLDAKYVARVNTLLERNQNRFNHIYAIATAVRAQIIKKGKTAHRLTGAHAWRNVTRAIFGELTDEEFVARVRATGDQRLIRRFLRHVDRFEPDRTALTSAANADLVRGELLPLFDGKLHLSTTEEYTCSPAAGFAMSTSRQLWPQLDGIPLPEIQEAILRGPDA